MINGDDAKRGAIEQAFPGMPVRLCQFHFMRACMQQARAAFPHNGNLEKKVQAFAAKLRKCQRCPSAEQWQLFYEAFQNDIHDIAGDNGQARFRLTSYFDREWFSIHWRKYCIDYGLPPQYTRDGPFSTNNYAESAFQTFNKVFLMCRVNKRSAILLPNLL